MKPYDISKTRTYNLSSPSSSYYTNNYSNTPNKNIADVYIDNKKNNDVTSTRGIGLLDNESFSIQEISSKSVVKVGSGRRKTQKKNKYKKRTTSKRR